MKKYFFEEYHDSFFTKIKRIKCICCHHQMAILCSLLIGFCIVAPQVFFIAHVGDAYRGIYPMKTDAEEHYLARMREFVDNRNTGNPFIYEYKTDLPVPGWSIAEPILATPALALPISIPTLNLVYKFLLPTGIALIVYGFMFRFVRDRAWSLVTSSFVLLGHTLLNAPDLVHLLRWDYAYTQFALYARPINPEFSSLIFFAYLTIYLVALECRQWRWFVGLGLLLGFSFYVYFYTFTFLVAFLGVGIITFWFQGDRTLATQHLFSFTLGSVLGLPVLRMLWLLLHHPYYPVLAHALVDLVAVSSHAPIVSSTGIITLLLFLGTWKVTRQSQHFNCMLLLLMTTFVVTNQQLITGLVLQAGHYHWYYNTPIYIVILMWIAFHFVKEKPRFARTSFLTGVLALSLLSTFLIQYSSYQYWTPIVSSQQRYAPVLEWLDNNSHAEDVVFANQEFSALVPIYTHDNVVWEAHAAYYLLPEERREFTPENLLRSFQLKTDIKKYRVDYLVWDQKDNPDWRLDQYHFTPVFSAESLTVYTI